MSGGGRRMPFVLAVRERDGRAWRRRRYIYRNRRDDAAHYFRTLGYDTHAWDEQELPRWQAQR